MSKVNTRYMLRKSVESSSMELWVDNGAIIPADTSEKARHYYKNTDWIEGDFDLIDNYK